MSPLAMVGLAAVVLGLGWALTEATIWLGEWWEDRQQRRFEAEFPAVAHWNTHPPQCLICYPGPIADSVDFEAWAREVGGR